MKTNLISTLSRIEVLSKYHYTKRRTPFVQGTHLMIAGLIHYQQTLLLVSFARVKHDQ
jgi:hypothetical protein